MIPESSRALDSKHWAVIAAIGLIASGCATRIDPVSVESGEIVIERWDAVDPLHGSQDSGVFLKLNVAGPQDLSGLAAYIGGRCKINDKHSGLQFESLLFLGYDDQLKLPAPEGPSDDGNFRYTIYAFPRLEVHRMVKAEYGQSIERILLSDLEFDSIACYYYEMTKVLPLPRKPQYWLVPSELTDNLEMYEAE